MKKTILAMALAASTAVHAETVTVTALGDTYEKAMANCQLTAAAKVTGTWVAGEQVLRDNEVSEEIATYNGAIINSTAVKTYRGGEMVCVVDVEPVKDNTVITKNSSVVPNLDAINRDIEELNKALSFVDRRDKALKVVINDITYKPLGERTNVYVDVDVVWDPKWISDVKGLLEKRNGEVDNTYDIRNQLLGSVVNVFATSGHPVFAAFAGDVMYEHHKHSTDHQICFGQGKKSIADDCWESVFMLQSFQDPAINIVVDAGGERSQWFIHRIEVKDLYERIYPNKTKSNPVFKTVKMTYMNPGIAIYTKERQKVTFGFSVPTKSLAEVDKLKFYIKE